MVAVHHRWTRFELALIKLLGRKLYCAIMKIAQNLKVAFTTAQIVEER